MVIKIPSVMHVKKKEKHSQLYFLAGHSLSIIALKMVFTGNRSRVVRCRWTQKGDSENQTSKLQDQNYSISIAEP